MEVIFRGEKHAIGSEAMLEYVVVNHKTFGVIEIVGFDKKHAIEANRLYVDDTLVRNEVGPDDAQLVAFLLNNICISNFNLETKLLEQCLSNQERYEPFTCQRPLGLKPYAYTQA